MFKADFITSAKEDM